jgi:hypothetical protein
MQYFLKPCFAIATTSFCSVSLMEDELTPGAPTNKMQSYAISITTMHWYTSQTDEAFFSQQRIFANCLMNGSFASQR